MVRAAGPQGPPAAVLGVYLHDSDLVLRSAFPILVTHLSEYLAPDAVPALGQSPGAAVTLAPGPGATEVLVTRPDGHVDTFSTRAGQSAAGGTVLFTDTAEAGLYTVTFVGEHGSRQRSYLAVDALGTPIAPHQSLEVSGTAAKPLPASFLYEDLWPWVALAALLVLLFEWVLYHRAG